MEEVLEEVSYEDKISSIRHVSDSEYDVKSDGKSIISLDEVDDRNPSDHN